MGTYEIPRNVKGEGRILFIFSTKSFIYTIIAAVIGLPFYFIFSAFGMTMPGIVVVVAMAVIGFVIIILYIVKRDDIPIHSYKVWLTTYVSLSLFFIVCFTSNI